MPVKLLEFYTTFERHWRRYCECCGFPSLGVPEVDARPFDGEPHTELIGVPGWESGSRHCDLCEWESRQLDDKGDPVSILLEEPNDGMTLEQARANFARFGSMYDPSNLPEWKVSAPSAEVQDARRVLREAYEAVLVAGPDAEKEAWHAALEAEWNVRAALEAQQAADEEHVAEEWDETEDPES